MPGKPDFYFPAARLAVFSDGCFWHGCKCTSHRFKTNPSFWLAKIKRNRQRDAQTTARLFTNGIKVLRFWEHELANDLPGCVNQIQAVLARN